MWNKSKKLDHPAFEARIGELLSRFHIAYRDIHPYIQAFVHRSTLNERITDFTEHNERLEFLGDAVLELIITEFLYQRYPDKTEGEMTDIRSALVRGDNLGRIGAELGFGDYIVMSKGEILSGGNANPFILADTFEAFLGAMYLDIGYTIVRDFLRIHLFPYIETVEREGLHIDPKSRLQEVTQAWFAAIPSYEVVNEEGLDHKKVYTIAVSVGELRLGIGNGQSKKRGEIDAAKNALAAIAEWRHYAHKK